MGIQVFGGMQQAGGLKSAMKEHRLHNAKQADELLQLTDGLDYNDPRAPYVPQDYPKMLFKPDPGEKGEKVVLTADEEAVAKQDGWRLEPYPRVQVVVLDPAQEKANLLDTNNRLQAQLVLQQEAMEKQQAETAELKAMMAELLSAKKGK
jgi:hypothetical protein